MSISLVWVLGAAAGSILGLTATVRSRDPVRILVGLASGAAGVAVVLAAMAELAEWIAARVLPNGIAAGSVAGLAYGGALGFLLGGIGISFFGFLLRPGEPVGRVLAGSFRRGAAIVAVMGALFGGLSGAVIGALRASGVVL